MKTEDISKAISLFHQELLSFRQEFLSFKCEMSEFRKETKNELDKHSRSLITIENTLKIYGDMYKINKDKIKSLDKRISVLESI